MFYLTVLLLVSVSSAFPAAEDFLKVSVQNESFQPMSDVDAGYDPLRDIVFYLYTTSNPIDPQIIKIDDASSLSESYFDASLPTRILVHGWYYDYQIFFVQEAKTEYLKKGRFNVIAADWSKGGGKTVNYITARYRVKPTGILIGQFVQFLEKVANIDISDVVLIGFSLGGHVVGNAGRQLGGRLPCIFCLDPADPFFFSFSTDRIMKSDAKYVEVIHTNTAFNGYEEPLGDTDFYPNGGYTQPGCAIFDNTCSHNSAPHYFIESINGATPFIGKKCASYDKVTAGGCDFVDGETKRMGGEPFLAGNGIFYLTTNDKSPFARG